jgi:nitrite reductase/ring-hydroxylating ferredoxin subunit
LPWVRIGKKTELSENSPLISELPNGTTVGVYKLNNKLYAYENICAHEGGPCVEGDFRKSLECKILPNGNRREYYSEEKFNITCPWHGVEYDAETGICKSNQELRLQSFNVELDGDFIKVEVP